VGALRRIVAVDGRLVEGRTLPGRGAWLCPDPACAALAARRRAFGRALRTDVDPDAVAAFVASWVG
jgi:predicted RNA-binding protein YlxR (DUF448 family)